MAASSHGPGVLRSFLAYADRRLDVVVFSRIAGDP
jgi:hypothetical protein